MATEQSPRIDGIDDTTPIFVISVAAQLAGMHPQTLRQYDRLGLVTPGRAAGRGRRYSARDVAVLREVQRLSQDEGVSLAGIKRILELEVHALRSRVAELAAELDVIRGLSRRVFAAGPTGEVVTMLSGRRPSRPATGRDSLEGGGALVVWRPQRRP
jgi:MerR family transcriptional regulator/heat shock protein HspR